MLSARGGRWRDPKRRAGPLDDPRAARRPCAAGHAVDTGGQYILPMTVNADTDGMREAQRVVTIPELSAPSYLQSVLSITHRDEGNSVPLTVAIPGGLVYGNAVHPSTWLRCLGEQLRDLTADDPSEAAEAMARMFEEMAGERTPDNPGPDIPVKDIRWVYFVDALVVSTSDNTPSYQSLACWQVALRDVIGWTIGIPPE